MKLKFKKQAYQTNAVEAVVDCFAGQPKANGVKFRVDPGRAKEGLQASLFDDSGFRNSDVLLPSATLLDNIRSIQVEHLSYDTIAETHSLDIFTQEKSKMDFSRAGEN